MKRAVLALVAGCGRIGFDTRSDAALIDDAHDAAGVPFDPAGCPSSYTLSFASTQSRYQPPTGDIPWIDAVAACAGPTGSSMAFTHMIVLSHDAERVELEALPLVTDVWIGLSDRRVEGSFVPVTLEDVAGYPVPGTSAWFPNEPNDQGAEDCAHTKPEGGLNDIGCGLIRPYVCECDGYADSPSQY